MKEHILQFAVAIDDDTIKKTIINKASDYAVKKVREELDLSGNTWCSKHRLTDLINAETDAFLEAHKDEIIELASSKLAERLVRTKAVKEKTMEVLDSVLGDK